MDATKYMCSAKHLKNKFDIWVTKLPIKSDYKKTI